MILAFGLLSLKVLRLRNVLVTFMSRFLLSLLFRTGRRLILIGSQWRGVSSGLSWRPG